MRSSCSSPTARSATRIRSSRRLRPQLAGIRVFTLGIDRAVNEAFLRRLAELGRGACELVESEDRLDEVMAAIHRQIGTPLLTGLALEPEGFAIEPDSLVPDRLPDLFAGAPLLVLGRFRGHAVGRLAVRARDAAGPAWSEHARRPTPRESGHRLGLGQGPGAQAGRSLRHRRGKTSASSSDRSSRVSIRHRSALPVHRLRRHRPLGDRPTTTGELHRITQPVESPQGWAVRAVSRRPDARRGRSLGWRQDRSAGLHGRHAPEDRRRPVRHRLASNVVQAPTTRLTRNLGRVHP